MMWTRDIGIASLLVIVVLSVASAQQIDTIVPHQGLDLLDIEGVKHLHSFQHEGGKFVGTGLTSFGPQAGNARTDSLYGGSHRLLGYDGKIYMTGYRLRVIDSIYFARVNAETFEVEAFTSYRGEGDFVFCTGLVRYGDRLYISSINRTEDPSPRRDWEDEFLQLWVLDLDGNVLRTFIPEVPMRFNFTYNMKPTQDSMLLLTMKCEDTNNGFYFLRKYDLEGNLIWSYSVDDIYTTGSVDHLELSDGSIVAVLTTDDDYLGSVAPDCHTAVRIDWLMTDGQPIRQTCLVPDDRRYTRMKSYAVAEASDGNLLVGGGYVDQYGYKAWLCKINVETREEMWRRMYTLPDLPTEDDQNLYEIVAIEPLDNGDLLLAARITADTSTALTWVFTVGPDGCRDDMDCTFDGSFVVPTQEVEVGDDAALSMYPNPARNTVTITASNAMDHIVLTDVTGRVCLTQSVGGTVHDVDVSRLHPGVYVITAVLASGDRRSRRVVVSN